MNIYHSLYIQDGDFIVGRRCVREKVIFVSKEIKDYFNDPKMFLLLVVYFEDRVWQIKQQAFDHIQIPDGFRIKIIFYRRKRLKLYVV